MQIFEWTLRRTEIASGIWQFASSQMLLHFFLDKYKKFRLQISFKQNIGNPTTTTTNQLTTDIFSPFHPLQIAKSIKIFQSFLRFTPIRSVGRVKLTLRNPSLGVRNRCQESIVDVSKNRGVYPQNGWFISWKTREKNGMIWGVPPILGNAQMEVLKILKPRH